MEQHLPHLADFHFAQCCLDRDSAAIARLGKLLDNVVASFLIRSGAQPGEAAEICKSLLATLVMPDGERKPRLTRYEGTSSLETWLHAVALNKLLSRKRSETRWRKLLVTPPAAPGPESDEGREPPWTKDTQSAGDSEAPLLDLMSEAIQAAFRSCEPEDFVLLQLSHCDGLLGKELAVMFGCHPTQISRRLVSAQKEIAASTLHHIRETDPWLELKWDDFTELCRTATPACFGLD